MLTQRILAASIYTVIICISSVGAQSVTQAVGNAGTIDWSEQIIRSTGIGAPNPNLPEAAQRASAIEAAKLAALRNLLETIQGMSLTSETTVRNHVIENDVINTRVRGAVRGFTMVDTRYMSTGDIEVTIEIPLSGILSDILLPQQMGITPAISGSPGLCPVCRQPWPPGVPVPPGVNLLKSSEAPAAAPADDGFTGLIVDARGLGARPAMAPRITDESGTEVYGSKNVSREWAVKIGMVGYDKDAGQARLNDRVADNPLVIKALQASGPNKADLIISSQDSQQIQSITSTHHFLDKCRVMFIVD